MNLSVQQKAFLAAYTRTGTVTAAAIASKVGRRNHYRWLEDADYKAEFDQAEERAVELLESEVRKRAMERSDILLMFLLKAKRPNVYRENSTVTHQGEGGGPLTVRVVFVKPSGTDGS